MPLKLYERPNGIWHIRGTVQGRRVDESAKTRIRTEAEQIRSKLEASLFRRAVYGDDAVATFAEAAEAYMLAGGAREHMKPLLLRLGMKRLSEVTQSELDALAAERSVKPSTLVRQIYTPVTAVLTFASSQAGGRLCAKPDFRKPRVRNTRTAYLLPDQAEAWITALPAYLARLVIFLLATGCRISEALELQWKDVSPDGRRVVFWQTKSDYSRHVDLQRRARDVLGERPDDAEAFVFLNSRGQPWHGYDAINLMLRRFRARHRTLAKVHCHLFRHTWATWAYACTRDLTFIQQQGGWRTLTMLGRYTHAGSPDLAHAVTARKWEFLGREIPGLKRRSRKG